MDPHDLYGLPLDRFTPERNALAKELRAEGQGEEATRVAAMRKPSVAAWAVNQLVRTQRREVKELFGAGDALQKAQSELLAGRGDAGALRDAADRERDAVDTLTAKARGLLSAEGHELTRATLERVSETLNAAALDEAARAQVQDGCLHRELRHVGLGGAFAAPAPGRGRTKQQAPSGRQAVERRPATRSEKAAERERAQRLRTASKTEANARRAADRATRALEQAQRRRDRAAEELHAAEAAVEDANSRAEEATRAHQRAQEELDRELG